MKNYKKNLELLTRNHVYSKEMEHDACGVGLIASTEGKKSRAIVEYGIEALKAVWHRGAVDADGKTGDGAGIHVEIPKDFFIEKIQVTGHDYDNSEICVGMIFLPRNDYSAQENCKTIVESELTKNNFSIYGWRQVPVNPKVLGEKALQTMPEIIQVLFRSNDPNLLDKDLERKIYETRKRIENKAFEASLNNFYICSISSKSIIYKGLYLAEAISDFYLDLKDKRFVSRYAIFHQRFSTNTAPSWSLAQPFRAIAHNGEINTYKGNKNWMKVHEQEMSSPLFDNVENLKPVIQKGVSDSAALDNVFELLNKSGQSAPLAKLMLVPAATAIKKYLESIEIKADMVIKALGFDPEDLPYLFDAKELQVTKWGTLKTDFDTMETNLNGVFAAGDIVRGASLVVWAIKDGRDAAAAIKKYLENKELKKAKVA